MEEKIFANFQIKPSHHRTTFVGLWYERVIESNEYIQSYQGMRAAIVGVEYPPLLIGVVG